MSDKYLINDRKYQLEFVDHMLDNIYGQIAITKVERELEKRPLFKRLHEISQLGLAKLIFPCAVHTRYVHSIGVMHTAYNMALHINMNTAGVKFEGIEGVFFSDAELQIIRLAGMLHDIGHYPLSHNIEEAYKGGANYYGNDQCKVVNRQEDLVGCPEFCAYSANPTKQRKSDKYLNGFSGNQYYHHEAIGRDIIINNREIFEIVKENFVLMTCGKEKYVNPCFKMISEEDRNTGFSEEDVGIITKRLLEMIAAMVIGNYDYDSEPPVYEYERKYSAMIQIIHSDMDADNLDYLLRDATFSGTSYGLMDVNILFNSLTVAELQHDDFTIDKDKDGSMPKKTHYIVGIKKKGIGCVEQFFHNKYLAYSQMIYSKYVSILEAMLLYWAKKNLPVIGAFKVLPSSKSIDESGNNTNTLKSKVTCKETNTDFLHFNDAFIMQEICKKVERIEDARESGELSPNPTLEAILSRLAHYTGFDLDEKYEECLCSGLGEDDILKSLEKNPLYKDYLEFISSIKDCTINDIQFTENEKKLLSYRFECFSMTKQIPLCVFEKEIASFDRDKKNYMDVLKKHYYRLANGIPIIQSSVEKTSSGDRNLQKYDLLLDNDGVKRDSLPDLIVDSTSSVMHQTWNQKFVYLRKYKVMNFE